VLQKLSDTVAQRKARSNNSRYPILWTHLTHALSLPVYTDHSALSCTATAIFHQLYLKPTVHISCFISLSMCFWIVLFLGGLAVSTLRLNDDGTITCSTCISFIIFILAAAAAALVLCQFPPTVMLSSIYSQSSVYLRSFAGMLLMQRTCKRSICGHNIIAYWANSGFKMISQALLKCC